MAYQIVYGSARNIATSYVKAYGCIKYEITSTDTTTTCKFYPGWEVRTTKSSGTTIYGAEIKGVQITTLQDNNGHSAGGSWSSDYLYKSTATKTYTHIGSTLRTWTYNRGTTAQTFTITYDTDLCNSMTLKVTVPARTKYTATYNANGGTDAPGPTYKYYGYNTNISSNVPSYVGHTFIGWADSVTNAKAGTVRFVPNSPWVTNESLNLYAVWEENKYTVNFHNNGITTTDFPENITNLKYASTFIVPNASSVDYALIEWNTNANGSGISYTIGQEKSVLDNIDLYAQWRYKYHNISFHESESSDYARWPLTKTEKEGNTMNFLNSCIPINNYSTHTIEESGVSKQVYLTFDKFNYWTTNNGIIYKASSIMPIYDLVLYPNWLSQYCDFSINKISALRASIDSDTGTFVQNDTGNSLILKIDYNRPTILQYYSNGASYGYEPVIKYPYTKIKVKITNDNDPENIKVIQHTFEEQEAPQSPFQYTIGLVNSGADWEINSSQWQEPFNENIKYNCEVTITAINFSSAHSEVDSIEYSASDFISKAQFTIDISADGDRLGIFQPINDYDENNPTIYPKHMVELNGGFKIQSDENSKGKFIIAENPRPINSNSTPEDSVYFSATRIANPNSTVYFGIGSGGVNRGIYLGNRNGNIGATSDGGGWMIYASSATNNRANVNIPGNLLVRGFAGIIQMTAIPAGGPGSSILVPANNTTIYEPILGWLICNGASVSKSTYPELFSVIQYTYGGSGDYFNLPDLRGRFPIGSGTGTATDATNHTMGTPATNNGTETVTLNKNQTPLQDHKHSHNIGVSDHAAKNTSDASQTHNHGPNTTGEYFLTVDSSPGNARFTISSSGNRYTVGYASADHFHGRTTTDTENRSHTHEVGKYTHTVTGSVGGVSSQDYSTINAHSNMPPFTGVNFIICTGRIA